MFLLRQHPEAPEEKIFQVYDEMQVNGISCNATTSMNAGAKGCSRCRASKLLEDWKCLVDIIMYSTTIMDYFVEGGVDRDFHILTEV
jgi:hypothetical protein